MTPDDIKDTPLEKFAEQRWGVMDTAPNAILIDNEIERRKRLHGFYPISILNGRCYLTF